MSFLQENNNKKHCKSCIFHPDPSKRIHLTEGRIKEINEYLTNLKSSHICHQTEKACYGGLEVQAKSMFEKKLIPEPTVKSLLDTAKLFLR